MTGSPGGPAGRLPFSSLARTDRLRLRSLLLSRIRAFFIGRGFIEIETPSRVSCPGIDPCIDALPAGGDRFLATSPELEMKKVLSDGPDRIFQIARAFRSGERGERHNEEFSILEWYAAGQTYEDLMTDTEELVFDAAAALCEAGVPSPPAPWARPFTRITVDEAFAANAGWRPSKAYRADPFFSDLVEKVEPALAGGGAVFLTDYPEPAGALARKKSGDPLVCERFELYLDGLEICNGFTELTDPVEQRSRFERDNAARKRAGREPYPIDESFLTALEAGIPPCAGNALGIDRLFMALTGQRRLADVTLLAGTGGIPYDRTMVDEKIRIDARGLEDPEPLRLLREALQSDEIAGKEIVILVDSREEVAKVKAFAGFTGCLLDPVEDGDHWEVRITPMCNCG